ncbi:MAG: carbohydrate ABC transporter substrate-binding protein [Clostridium butyricum]|nr:carbohydrate ABC transporter substrate-binding protein [Clostridium butyricum]
MKNKIKYGFIFFIAFIVVIISINLNESNKNDKVRGNIQIWASNNTYNYLRECANEFMELNEKVYINVNKIEQYSFLKDSLKNGELNDVKIFESSLSNFNKLKLDDFEYYNPSEEILSIYSNNFSKYRINQLGNEQEIVGIPLTSRPLALYLREDLLEQYGYKNRDFNTWEDVIRIGNDIYNKSDKNINILNAIDQDYYDLVDLLIMQNLDKDKTNEEIEEIVLTKIEELKNNNILNTDKNKDYIAKIASINAIKDIDSSDEKWSVVTVPSSESGKSKFFSSEGTELYILKSKNDNDKLIDKFIIFLLSNNSKAINYISTGDFFSSYLYTYKDKKIETPKENFNGQNPLIVLSNVEEKTNLIDEYYKYLEIRTDMGL